MMKTKTKLGWAGCLALLAATTLSLTAQEADEEYAPEVTTHMHEHLANITSIKQHIIMGDLDGVREPAIWLAEHESVDGLPDNFEFYVQKMRDHARQVADAPDLDSAAIAVSRMAQNCGNCHQVNGIGVEIGFGLIPDDMPDTVTHMRRHQWAVDQLWIGLISPSDEAWSRGANVLVDVALGSDDVMDETVAITDPEAISVIARSVHTIGGLGTKAKTPDYRGALYGEMLTLCSDCHSLLGRGPGQ